MKKALLVVDLLKDFFPGGRLSCDRVVAIIPNIQYLLSVFRRNGQLVVYINDSHLSNVDKEFEIWGPHAIRGHRSSEVIDDLDVLKSDFIVHKRRYSGFSGTDLHYLLIEHKIETVVLCGIHTHVCIRHTAYDAFLNGYRIEVVEDAVEAFSEEENRNGLEYLKMIYGAKLIKSKDIII